MSIFKKFNTVRKKVFGKSLIAKSFHMMTQQSFLWDWYKGIFKNIQQMRAENAEWEKLYKEHLEEERRNKGGRNGK
ncbi:hypothetical protein LNZ35_004329 [Salmonella enterica]|nr:hypothetical protein [Salmonella enterica]